jgi:pyruvate,water dikinase
MSWIRNLFLSGATKSEGTLDHIQTKFTHFLLVIEKNNQVLKVISDMEEKLQGEFLFDIAYVRSCLRELRSGALELIEEMIALGGKEYESLLDCFTNIDNRIGILLPGCRPLTADELTVPFDALVRERACSVGSKNAQLGEMRNRVNLPVPDGFAISAWAYKSILDANDLQARISDKLLELDIKEYHQLVQVSGEIRELVKSVCIPGDVKEAIESATAKLVERSGARRFSLRSSAIGEDTLHSFAGQYATFLNVPSELVVERYCDVLASKFTPQAIYYYLSHALSESELAMSVGCVVMIDACASGVVYTRDPLRPGEDVMLIHAVFGLGKYLVDGTLTPDVYRVSRSDGKLIQSEIAVKLRKLMLNPDGGTVEKSVDDEDQARPVLSEKELSDLADFGRRLEDHYGCPQDIEFAVDGEGRVCLLQTRPLRVMDVSRLPPEPDVSGLTPLMDGGETVCPGAGGGPIHHVSSPSDLATIPDGAVVAAAQSFPGIITVMNRASAIVTETGGTANHMATIAREYHIPTLSGVSPISRLPQGEQVTVDATSGMIYAGYQEKLIEARRPEYELFADLAIFGLLRDVLKEISPLNLIHPTDDNFAIDNCRTFHDITRFCHQRAMDEMFHGGLNVEDKDSISVRLKKYHIRRS